MPTLPAPALALLRQQHGLIARYQAAEVGLTPQAFDGLTQRGTFERVHRGVYRLAGAPIPDAQHVLAAVLRCGRGARATGPAVLGLLGVEGFRPTAPVEVLAPVGRTLSHVPFVVRPDLEPGLDRMTIGVVPAVTGTRALIDTRRTVGGKPYRVAVDSGCWRGVTSVPRLRRRAAALPEHEGARLVVELIDQGIFEQESEGERALAPVLAGFTPPPLWGQWVAEDIRVDVLWPHVRLVIEYDGRDSHEQGWQRQADNLRDRRLEAMGYVVVHVTRADLRQPEVLKARLAGLLQGLSAPR